MHKYLVQLIVISLTLSVFCTSTGVAASPQIIVNQSVDTTALSRTDLRLLFAGRRQFWADGTKVTVFVLPANTDVHRNFCADLLAMYPYQLEHIWHQITYSGLGDSPIIVTNQRELVERVNTTKGAIGYVANKPGWESMSIKFVSMELGG